MNDAELGRWPVAIDVPVAWGDMDAFAHVNNTVYLRWFESGRIAYFDQAGVRDRVEVERIGPILARATIDFRLPLTYPDSVRVETTVLKIGRTSFTMGYRVKSQVHGGKIAAEGDGVIVLFDYENAKSVEIDERLRERIRALEATAPA